MKKLLSTIVLAIFSVTMIAQTNWQKGGNTNFSAPPGLPPTIGTDATWNSPLQIITTGAQRMVINNNVSSATTAAAFGATPGPTNKNGFVGINVTDPWSRLHVAATGSVPYGGYRPWMREGITMQNANDQLWLGHIQWSPANTDAQNAVINWGDDSAPGPGPDHMVFNYTLSSFNNPGYPAPGITPSPSELNGLEVMRMSNIGYVGVGPRFSNLFPPTSMLHVHKENDSSAWIQVTNQYMENA
jgi:hypothetical protein